MMYINNLTIPKSNIKYIYSFYIIYTMLTIFIICEHINDAIQTSHYMQNNIKAHPTPCSQGKVLQRSCDNLKNFEQAFDDTSALLWHEIAKPQQKYSTSWKINTIYWYSLIIAYKYILGMDLPHGVAKTNDSLKQRSRNCQ